LRSSRFSIGAPCWASNRAFHCRTAITYSAVNRWQPPNFDWP